MDFEGVEPAKFLWRFELISLKIAVKLSAIDDSEKIEQATRQGKSHNF